MSSWITTNLFTSGSATLKKIYIYKKIIKKYGQHENSITCTGSYLVYAKGQTEGWGKGLGTTMSFRKRINKTVLAKMEIEIFEW